MLENWYYALRVVMHACVHAMFVCVHALHVCMHTCNVFMYVRIAAMLLLKKLIIRCSLKNGIPTYFCDY